MQHENNASTTVAPSNQILLIGLLLSFCLTLTSTTLTKSRPSTRMNGIGVTSRVTGHRKITSKSKRCNDWKGSQNGLSHHTADSIRMQQQHCHLSWINSPSRWMGWFSLRELWHHKQQWWPSDFVKQIAFMHRAFERKSCCCIDHSSIDNNINSGNVGQIRANIDVACCPFISFIYFVCR